MRGVCFYACACSARRENAGTLVRSAFLHGNYRSLVHFHSAGAACAAFLFARQFVQHPASYAGGLFLCLTDWGVLNPLLPFGLSSPVTEQLKLALRGKANFAACLTLGCSFYPTKKSKISLRGPLLHLPKCGTCATFLLRVYFSHPHNRADNGTNRTSLTGRGRRLASHYARVCLITHQAREVAERAAAFKRRLHRL